MSNSSGVRNAAKPTAIIRGRSSRSQRAPSSLSMAKWNSANTPKHARSSTAACEARSNPSRAISDVIASSMPSDSPISPSAAPSMKPYLTFLTSAFSWGSGVSPSSPFRAETRIAGISSRGSAAAIAPMEPAGARWTEQKTTIADSGTAMAVFRESAAMPRRA